MEKPAQPYRKGFAFSADCSAIGLGLRLHRGEQGQANNAFVTRISKSSNTITSKNEGVDHKNFQRLKIELHAEDYHGGTEQLSRFKRTHKCTFLD
jgi:hypothetical protein